MSTFWILRFRAQSVWRPSHTEKLVSAVGLVMLLLLTVDGEQQAGLYILLIYTDSQKGGNSFLSVLKLLSVSVKSEPILHSDRGGFNVQYVLQKLPPLWTLQLSVHSVQICIRRMDFARKSFLFSCRCDGVFSGRKQRTGGSVCSFNRHVDHSGLSGYCQGAAAVMLGTHYVMNWSDFITFDIIFKTHTVTVVGDSLILSAMMLLCGQHPVSMCKHYITQQTCEHNS